MLGARRLARLVRVRKVQEELARAAWLESELAARNAADRRQAAQRHAERSRREVAALLGAGTLEPAQLLWRHQLLDSLERELTRLRERARTLRFQADAARAPWDERRREKRALERLRERALEREAEEEFKRENIALDEVAGARAARSMRSNGPTSILAASATRHGGSES